MILNAYSIFDRKALQYHPPFFASTDGAAIRSLRDLVSDINTTVGRHPADYVLFLVGRYDDSNGSFLPLSPLSHVVDAVAVAPAAPAPLFEQRPARTDPLENPHNRGV